MVLSSSLIQRLRAHVRDDRINSDDEADAEIELMSKVEFAEVLSFLLDQMFREVDARV